MMSREDIEYMLDKIELAYRYHHFEEEEAVTPPFICWLVPGSNNFSADGICYLKMSELDIELYTDQKDFKLEEKVESVLEKYGVSWRKTETYIEQENMYEVLYETEV